jgi:type I restriction enzyme, S subunit
MSRWDLVALGEIFEIARGGSPRPIDDYITDDPDGINWIMIGDASEESKYISHTKKRIRQEGVKRSRVVHPGDFLLTNSMSFGKPYILRTSGCIHDGWLVLSKKVEGVDPDFFYHLLRSKVIYSEFARLAAGATVKNLNIELVSGVKVLLPPLPEQRRIAEVLDRAEALRAKRRAALAHLEVLAGAAFFDLFGDLVKNNPNWPVASVGDLCRRVTVGIVVQPASYYRASGVPALRSLNVRPNEIVTNDLVFFSPEDNERLSKTRIWQDDIVLVRSGKPGTAAIIPEELSGINAIDLLIVTPDAERIHPSYLCWYFNSAGGQQIVLGEQRGQIQKHLNVASLKAAPIAVPPLTLQHEFARRVAAVERLKAAQRTSLAEMDALVASLQHRAFRGEL